MESFRRSISTNHAECGVFLHAWCGQLFHTGRGRSVCRSVTIRKNLKPRHLDREPYLLAYCGLKIDLDPQQNRHFCFVSVFTENRGFSLGFKTDPALLVW